MLFVDPTWPNNVQRNYLNFFFFAAEGFNNREIVIDGISFELEPVMKSGKWMLTIP